MKSTFKDRLIAFGFVAILVFVLAVNLISPDAAMSVSERRKLAQLPEADADSVLSGEYFTALDDYALDQFILRDELRALKSVFRLGALMQLENNGLFIEDGGIYKQSGAPDEFALGYNSRYLAGVAAEHFSGSRVFWSVVPEKVMLLDGRESQRVPLGDFVDILAGELGDEGYIGLDDTLEVVDYYRTDPHWRQECLVDTADRLLTVMTGSAPERAGLREEKAGEFLGSYYGQLPLINKTDELRFLADEATDGATVYDYESRTTGGVYREEKLTGLDPYDYYLAGARALLRIDNPSAQSERELIVIRDSFGSSIAPLLLDSYSTVYLVDLRYIAPALLDELIEPAADSDLLILLSASILNKSGVFR